MFKGSLRAMLYVRDVPTSVAFYTGKLGFSLEGSWGRDYATVLGAGQAIGLHAVAPGTNVAVGGVVLYTEVTDVDAYYESLVRRGVATSEPRDETWGERVFAVRDPDGHEWGFVTPLKAAKTKRPAKTKAVRAKAKKKAQTTKKAPATQRAKAKAPSRVTRQSSVKARKGTKASGKGPTRTRKK
jgi:uncharacterized glyoxalase superfamily protein PhnB